MLKCDFDPSITFSDNENMAHDEALHQVMQLGNDNGIEEKVKFSCMTNLKGTILNIYKKINIAITNKKIYSMRKKNIKPIIYVEDIIGFTLSKDIKNKHFIIHIKE